MNKINLENAILINSIKEIDYYDYFIKNFPKNFFSIIINDFKDQTYYKEIREKTESNSINFKYELYSVALKKGNKYNYLISTGLGHFKKITFKSLIIFIYAQTVGATIEYFNLGIVFNKIFSKSMICGGKLRPISENKLIEKNISKKTILFPRGLDMHISAYPEKSWIKTFDFFCCHGELDKTLLIKKKIKIENIFKIGYPRYEKFFIKKSHFEPINFKNLNRRKKTILWMPTHIKYPKKDIGSNILLWEKYCYLLTKEHNVIIRPHPKTLPYIMDEVNNIREKGFIIDTQNDQILGKLYTMADLILVDYGGSIFSSIYMNKKILLLNLPFDHNYFLNRKKDLTLDQIERKRIKSLDLEKGSNLPKIVNSMIIDKVNYNRDLYFNKNDNIKNFKKEFFNIN